MVKKSAPKCIEDNDLEAAIYRYSITTSQWKDYWWKTIVEIYNTCEEWAKKYVLDPICKAIRTIADNVHFQKLVERVQNGEWNLMWSDVNIVYLNNTQSKDTGSGEKAYLFKFYDKDASIPIFSKIGTTTKLCLNRLKDEIRYYRKKAGFNIACVEICEIWDCGETPAESYESFARALLIKKYPNTWHKNDRFFGVNVPTESFTALCKQYENFA